MTNEELEQEVKRLEEQITNLRIKILEGLIPYKPYEVEVPEDIDDYYYTNEYGKVDYLDGYNTSYEKNKYIRGLAFKTEKEAEQYDKERILLFKMHKWAEEHNGGWTPNWDDCDEEKYTVRYDYSDNNLETFYSYSYKEFSKLPYFISNDTAKRFIDEFGDEIKEVLC
nr:MAG TPA: hypothetical protein [Caudoviricetes sp.]